MDGFREGSRIRRTALSYFIQNLRVEKNLSFFLGLGLFLVVLVIKGWWGYPSIFFFILA